MLRILEELYNIYMLNNPLEPTEIVMNDFAYGKLIEATEDYHRGLTDMAEKEGFGDFDDVDNIEWS